MATKTAHSKTLEGKIKPTKHVIDATNRTLGRVASEAAHALLGKRSVHYALNITFPIKVIVENAGKMHLPERRTKGKIYTRYTGYPGGFFKTRMDQMIDKKGIAFVLTKTIDGMIPRNKLRTPRMKNLTVKA